MSIPEFTYVFPELIIYVFPELPLPDEALAEVASPLDDEALAEVASPLAEALVKTPEVNVLTTVLSGLELLRETVGGSALVELEIRADVLEGEALPLSGKLVNDGLGTTPDDSELLELELLKIGAELVIDTLLPVELLKTGADVVIVRV